MVNFQPGASLAQLVDALNMLGVTPSDLVAILESLKQAGALNAEIDRDMISVSSIHPAGRRPRPTQRRNARRGRHALRGDLRPADACGCAQGRLRRRDLFGSQGTDTFHQMMDERFADIMADSGALGFGKSIEAQLAAHLAPNPGHEAKD